MSVDPTNLGGTAQVTFDDEFNALSLWNGSSGVWSTTYFYQDLTNSTGSNINGEAEWYLNANYGPTQSVRPWTVNNGFLTITAAPATAAVAPYLEGHAYTSGELNTFHSHAQTYGYFEVRAMLPSGHGFWPAFWLMPESGGWPPELDVMEALSDNPTALGNTSHSAITGMLSNDPSTGIDLTAGFHTYGMDWEPDFITWYLDGKQVFQIATPGDMNEPMYMILNLAAGGSFAASPTGVGQLQVDWVRAYAPLHLGGAANTTYDAATDTISTNGNFTMPTTAHNLVLTGAGQTIHANDLGDVITSSDMNNLIIGGSGNDVIIAGRGRDLLSGGGGDNTFVYVQTPWNTGIIGDFKPGHDQIDLRPMMVWAGYAGSNPVGDGRLVLQTDASGNTGVWFSPDGAAAHGAWIITLNHVQASALQVVNGFIVGAWSSPNTGYMNQSKSSSPYIPPSTNTDVTAPVTAPSAPPTGSLPQTTTPSSSDHTYNSDNKGDYWTGTAGDDTFHLGRGGDVVAGNGGTDTFAFAQVPWGAGTIADFHPGDVLDLTGLLADERYAGSNPLADGYLAITTDSLHNAQVWANYNQAGNNGWWLVETLTGVSASSLVLANGVVTQAASSSTPSGQTYRSDNNGDHWTGTAGDDTFHLGRGGDVVAGNGGNNTFAFAQVPWGAGTIVDFHPGDVLDLTGLLADEHYAGSNPLADGYLAITTDSAHNAQVWANYNQPGNNGWWLVETLKGVSTSTLALANGVVTEAASSSAASGQTYRSDNNGDHWTGTSGDDTFHLGRGGDVVAGNGGNDTFAFAENPWSLSGRITDFNSGDVIDLTETLHRASYASGDPVSQGYVKFTNDASGNAQVWFNPDPSHSAAFWLVTGLDGVNAGALHANAGLIAV